MGKNRLHKIVSLKSNTGLPFRYCLEPLNQGLRNQTRHWENFVKVIDIK